MSRDSREVFTRKDARDVVSKNERIETWKRCHTYAGLKYGQDEVIIAHLPSQQCNQASIPARESR